MNAPFDSVGVVEAAMRAVEAGEGPLILSPGAPLESARQLVRRRYTQLSGRTIQHQQGVFYAWDGTHYRGTSRDEIRAIVYEFLDSARRLDSNSKLVPFNPNRAKVADVVEALAATSQLPELLRAPTWLDADQNFRPVDIFACSNGLLHLPTRTLMPHTPAYFSVNAVEYPYDPKAQDPIGWLAFLYSLWPKDPRVHRDAAGAIWTSADTK